MKEQAIKEVSELLAVRTNTAETMSDYCPH